MNDSIYASFFFLDVNISYHTIFEIPCAVHTSHEKEIPQVRAADIHGIEDVGTLSEMSKKTATQHQEQKK